MSTLLKKYWVVLAALLATIIFLSASYATLSTDQLLLYSAEDGLIEDTTALLLLLGVLIGIYAAAKTHIKSWYIYAFLTLIAALSLPRATVSFFAYRNIRNSHALR